MICTTIQNRTLEEIIGLLEGSEPRIQMAEIRLDRCPLDIEEIESLFSSSDTPLVATCRVVDDGNGTWEEAEEKLTAAVEAGAAFLDLEIEAPKEVGKRLRRACTEYGTTMIRSSHFFAGTPSDDVLRNTVEKCRKFGGEIVKIAAMAKYGEDVARVLELYSQEQTSQRQAELIAFSMGETGRASRLECLRLGSPFTYAALNDNEAAAPGQWTYSEMIAAVYGERRPLHCDTALNMPASKSFAQRAIIAAALADGESRLEGYSPCGDNEAAIEVAKALGAEVRVEAAGVRSDLSDSSTDTATGTTLTIKGAGSSVNMLDKLNVGESGLLTRLMIPIVAALGKGQPIEIDGIGTLPARPLKGASEIMAGFGTVLRPLNPAPEVHVPLTVQGPLLSGKTSVSGKGGSQLISGLLMALPLLPGDSTLHIHDPKSIPYMFITADVLRRFGIKISSEMEGGEDFLETQDWSLCTGITFKIKGGQKYSPAAFDIEGDWSAAANFLVAGALFGDVKLTGLDTTSLQADISIMDILMEAGASLSQIEDEPQDEESANVKDSNDNEAADAQEAVAPQGHRGLITAQKAPLRAFDTDLNNCPDLFPIVAILAAFCHGRSNIQGFKRLASKESDRGAAILNMLTQMGVEASAAGDILSITGESVESRLLNGHLLKGGEYTSSHDHRMAMALTVASWCADSPIQIDDTTCIAKSFPAFLDAYRLIER
ncbi:MAG: type I 3-dehydroquinate dehydratase [Alistipes sp.]|jgi:3-phosphoshikimate 1-carboxyvinyltransferase|nr:type I 3-dehydroquinate dehydratase [Alistipes sp.]MDY5198569.1 type I 3-dehydroquinate dehydratase [Candidatus Cryptobacteroides sp.]